MIQRRNPDLTGSGLGGAVNLLDLFGLADEPWMDDSLCAQTDPEAFFPEKGGSTREAKKTCLACEVRAECLTYALENHERYGIWGGLSERERRKIQPDLPDEPDDLEEAS